MINTWFNRQRPIGEINKLPSQTVPDQAMPMSEILKRFARGQTIPSQREGDYSEEDFTQLEKMDLFERMDFQAQNSEYIQELRKELQNPEVQTTDAQGTVQSGDNPVE